MLAPLLIQANDKVDTTDVLRCDVIYRPPGCIGDTGGRNNIKDSLSRNLGVNLQRDTAPIDMDRVVIAIDSSAIINSPFASASTNRQRDVKESVAAVNSDAGDVDKANSRNSELPSFNGSQTGGQAMQQPPAIQTKKSNGVTVAGGLAYADDDPEPVKKVTETANGSLAQTLNNGASAVAMNKKMESPSGDDDSSPRHFGNSSAPLAGHNQGTYESGAAKGTTAPKGDGYLGRLAAIANGMGKDNFLGTDGAKGSKRRGSRYSRKRSKLKKGNTQTASLDPNMRNMLKNGMSQFRGLASKLEFSSANSSLFGKMCSHYDSYARANRIPNDRSRCPQK